jgi:hypothetical protein
MRILDTKLLSLIFFRVLRDTRIKAASCLAIRLTGGTTPASLASTHLAV